MNKNDQEFLAQKIRTQYTEKENTQLDELKRLDVGRCIECGICSFVCPSKINLREYEDITSKFSDVFAFSNISIYLFKVLLSTFNFSFFIKYS